MAGPRRTNRSPTRHPLSDELYKVRQMLHEDQTTFAKRFRVTRTTLLGWERYRPPMHAGVQQWIAIVCARAKREATRKRQRKERQESTWNS